MSCTCVLFWLVGDTVADRASIYSEKIAEVICCWRCRKPTFEPTEGEGDRQSLTESFREELLTSSYHEPLQENDLECSLAT